MKKGDQVTYINGSLGDYYLSVGLAIFEGKGSKYVHLRYAHRANDQKIVEFQWVDKVAMAKVRLLPGYRFDLVDMSDKFRQATFDYRDARQKAYSTVHSNELNIMLEKVSTLMDIWDREHPAPVKPDIEKETECSE